MARYSIEDTTLTAIADAIRSKTGLTDDLMPEQMIQDIIASPSLVGDVEDYVLTEAENVSWVVQTIQKNQSDNAVTFIALSDVHVGSDAQSRASALHAMQGARLIADRVGTDFTAVLGDWVTGGSSDSSETHKDNLLYALEASSILSPDNRLQGNHDSHIYNADNYLSAAEIDNYITRYNVGAISPGNNRGYFYRDFVDKKLRVICLNTADLTGVSASASQDGHKVSAEQLSWLVSTLNMTGKSDWHIILLSHHPIHWIGDMVRVLAILEAYVKGGSGSLVADGSTISFNFNGKNAAELVGTFHGHTHNFIFGKEGTAEIVRMGTPNACFGRNNEYGSSYYSDDFRLKYGEVNVADDGTLTQVIHSKTANSANDTSFCVYVVDFDEKIIHSIPYGVGISRSATYGDSTYYSITNYLTNVTSSNGTSLVKEGTVYSATLTATDGYVISNFAVTMGGVDITSTVYSNGVITIPEVTGDIIIIAKATGDIPAGNYTNLVKTAQAIDSTAVYNGTGYKDGYRLSSSDPYEAEATGYVATGLIPYSVPDTGVPGTIYIYGADWNEDDNCRIRFFDASKEILFPYITGGGTNTNALSAFYTLEKLGSRYYKLTPIVNPDSSSGTWVGPTITSRVSDAEFIRFSLAGSGDSLVITVDEPIVGGGDNGYTNIIDTIGYTDDYRLSTATGELKVQDGYVTTGLIDLGRAASGDVIRTHGVDFRAANHSYSARVYYSDAAGTFLSANYLNPYEGTTSTSIAFDDDGNMTMTIYENVRYLKLCGYGSGANLIVTINEEITGVDSDDNGTTDDANNLVPTATDATGAIFNGTGYMSGKRWGSDSTTFDTYKDDAETILIGMIPFTIGQTLRIKGIDIENTSYSMFKAFKADRSNLESGYMSFHTALNTAYPTQFTLEGDTATFTPVTSTTTHITFEMAYIGIAVEPLNGAENVVVTVDDAVYTNLVPTSVTPLALDTVFNKTGYMNGAYASSASPYYGSDSATVCVGCIPITDNYVFYIKGITLDVNASSHCRVGIGSVHATLGTFNPSAVAFGDAMSSYATIETLGDQYYKLTFSEAYITSNFTRQPYFLLSGVGTGENLIITANEPIE